MVRKKDRKSYFYKLIQRKCFYPIKILDIKFVGIFKWIKLSEILDNNKVFQKF